MIINLDQNNCTEKAEMFLRNLGRQAQPAIARALNRVAKGVPTDSVKEVRKEYNVKAGPVRKSFEIKKAKPAALEARAKASGHKVPLINFGARPSSPGRRKPALGVSVQVKKQRKVLRHSFVARMKSGHIGVFQREGEFRLPIEQKFGPSIPEMISNEKVINLIQENANERFKKNLDHEIDYVLQKMGAR